MRIKLIVLFCLGTILLKAQTPYSHPVITVQNPHYITQLSQATNTDTNVVKSTTTLGGSYMKMSGTAAKHIVIVNEGGVVQMTGGMEIDDCHYLDIIGWGSNAAFGFRFLNGNSSGNPVHIVGKSSNIMIKGYELHGGINGGIWAKTEVGEVSSRYSCDLSYLTTPMLNITLSCNWVQDCGGEAFYIGSTGWKGDRPMVCGGVTTFPIPQKIGYIHCDSNIIINPGRTGAQMSGSITNSDNYGTFIGNKTYNTGRELNSYQGVGLSIGGSFLNPILTGNEVHTSYLYNYFIQGYGNVIFDNNFGDSSGYWKNTKNPEQIPASLFSTSVAPTSWKIRNNVEGYNSAQPSTGYVLYVSNKNADTGNIICNNVGLVVIKDNPLIYSNNCAVTNIPPTVNAGSNVTLTLPTNSYQLNGSSSDIDGVVSTNVWTKISGPTYTISNANILNPLLTNLLQGVYLFKLTATDNAAASTSDTMQITVNPAPVNNAPVANAGMDIEIQLPTTSTQLNGTATDDVSIASVLWSQIGGTTATISNTAILNPNITGLTTAGTRTFRLIVTDNLGLKDTDDVNVNVMPAPNIPPVVSAGADVSITSPATTINLSGTATDADGTIASTLWTNTDGCSITSASSLTTTATCTILGAHVFTLTATDNQGATTQDEMIGTVNAAANVAPVAIAQNDTTVYLPIDSLILTQSGTDADGTIANKTSYIIQTFYGATLKRPNTFTPAIRKLEAGDTIKIVLRVTDDDSAYGYDTTTVIVLDTTNNAPTADINRDTSTTATEPVGQILIDGSSSFDHDQNDFIAAYLWTQVSGANDVVMTGTTGSVLILNSMTAGLYCFRLTVTDSHGLQDSINFCIDVEMKLKFKFIKKSRSTSFAPPEPPAPMPFGHGFNNVSLDSAQNRLKSHPNNWATVKAVNEAYSTRFLRYPGGSSSLSYFPDTLGRISNQILYDFSVFIGDAEHANQYADKGTRYKPYDYEQFLRMADSMHVTPIIVLNNQFYRDGDSIYLLEHLEDKDGNIYDDGGLHSDRWTVAIDSLTDKVNFSHSIYGGVIYWELGNECYARMSAAGYVESATNFLNTIKALYPNDKFIGSISKGDYQHNPIENDQWNHDIIAGLEANGALYDIDYFAPHFYQGSSACQANEGEISNRFRTQFFPNLYNYLLNDAGFPINYFPQLFYTEYSVSKIATGDSANPCTNTQYHGMMTLDAMMHFQRAYIKGACVHTWVNDQNGSFYDSTEAQDLGYIPTSQMDNPYFRYITPQAIADSLFLATVGDEPIDAMNVINNFYRSCGSRIGNTVYTQILNWTPIIQNYPLVGSGVINWTAVSFNDIGSHSWNVTANITTGSNSKPGVLVLPARSFVFFNEQELEQ